MATNIESLGSTDPDFTDSMGVIGAGAINVKAHFGAVGNGETNDAAAIQAAFDESVLADNEWTSEARGGVYFPPGRYLVNSTINLASGGQSGGRIFAHRGTVVIIGNVAGFLFDCENPEVAGVHSESNRDLIIEGLNIKNENAAGGCVRLWANQHTTIRDCNFSGHHGVFLGASPDNDQIAFDSIVINCAFNGIGTEGSWSTSGIGLALGHQCRAIGCNFVTWDVATVLAGAQASLYSCRYETNNVAIYNGIRTDLSTASSNNGGIIMNSSFESNKYDIRIRDANGLAIIGAQAQGEQSAPHDSQASIHFVGGGKIVIQNYVASGTFDKAPFWIESNPSSDLSKPGITFISCEGGMLWEAGNHSGCCEQVNCELYTDFTNTIAQLPTYASTGTRRTVTNSAQAVGTDAWGTAISGTGANTVPVWYDGSAWRLG
jgi:hypothetical protein